MVKKVLALSLLVSVLCGYADDSSNNGCHSKEYIDNNTHYVHGYYRKNGTYVNGYLAGNPHSGVHCHENVCC